MEKGDLAVAVSHSQASRVAAPICGAKQTRNTNRGATKNRRVAKYNKDR